MKKILVAVICSFALFACGSSKLKSNNGVFTDTFQSEKRSPWIDTSKQFLTYQILREQGLKISNTSLKYHAGVNYHDFPVNMIADFETTLEFSMSDTGNFTFYLGYKDAKHRELFSFSEDKGKFYYSRYNGENQTERINKNCSVNKGVNELKLIKKENEVFLFLNDELIMNEKDKPTFSNSFGFGLSPETSVVLRQIKIAETPVIK